MRAPRFEPGSSAWQADVLDQTRLRALGTSVNPITDKNLTTPAEAKIANTLIQLKATQSQMWYQFRAKAAEKLHKPQLLNIALRNLRNYSGERFYKNLPTRDPILLMQHFRHKKLERTMHYTRAIILDCEEDEQFISRISTTIQEDAKLIENGFQYVTERDGKKLFRKRK